MPRKEKSAAGRVSLSLVSDMKKIFMFLSAMADNCSNLFLKEYVSNRAITSQFAFFILIPLTILFPVCLNSRQKKLGLSYESRKKI